MDGSAVFGVIGGDVDEARVGYLKAPLVVTADVLALAEGVEPTEVFRFAAPCAAEGCQHFNGSQCTLVSRIVALVPPVVDELPRCPIRARCRWFSEQGGSACHRCPVVVTRDYRPTPEQRAAASPPNFQKPTSPGSARAATVADEQG